jgi:hypothetical protein
MGCTITDLDAESGVRDAKRALDLASEMQQPTGSAIYFGVDWDFSGSSDLAQITAYFEKVREALFGKYLIGVYGSGTVGLRLQQRALIEYLWLAGATGWSGTGNWRVRLCFGQVVTEHPKEGDIVVFRRRSPTESGGHVGFFISQQGEKIQILGDNQGNAISIAPFPRDGTLGSTHYAMLSIRRAMVTPE